MNLTVQDVSGDDDVPGLEQIRRWVASALEGDAGTEITVRIVDEDEMAELNSRYRHKDGPTNVLSFPFDTVPGVATTFLGDIVICAPVVRRESREQGKDARAHWAHMVVHGVLHLQGYDHENDDDARQMEERETAILTGLGFPAPYSPYVRA